MKCDGLHTAYLYDGTPGADFSWNVDDYRLNSANNQIDNANFLGMARLLIASTLQ